MKYLALTLVTLSCSSSVLAAGLSCTFLKNYEVIETRSSQTLDLEYWFPADGNVGVSIGGDNGIYGINIHESCGRQCDSQLLGGAWEVTGAVRADGRRGEDIFSAKCLVK